MAHVLDRLGVDRLRGELAYRHAKHNLDLEQRDLCGSTFAAFDDDVKLKRALAEADKPTSITAAKGGDEVIGGGKVIKTIPGMGKVYDWRTSPWTPASGGRINPLVFVQHIPVVPNMTGIADFVRLRDVLVAQGLMVQSATDRDGNVALFTPFDVLCFQARGANQVSCGCEHMHMTLGESWTKRQLRAAAWLVQLANRKHGIPITRARLGSGSGLVRVTRRGQTTHRLVSDRAGFHDRTDPGPGYDFEQIKSFVAFFAKHGHFKGS